MRRIWLDLGGRLPADISDGETLKLSDEAFHHAIKVSRLELGERFESITGHDILLQLEIMQIDKKSALVKVVGRRMLPALRGPEVHLAVSLCKWDAFDWIIEKSVELGVSSIQPIISQNSFIKRVDEISPARRQRWQKTVESATTQSVRGSLMRIEPPVGLYDFIKKINQDPSIKCLFAYEGARKVDLKAGLKNIMVGKPRAVWALVGSEGGFSAAEAEEIQRQGFEPLTMGDQILRVETACIALMSIIKYELN